MAEYASAIPPYGPAGSRFDQEYAVRDKRRRSRDTWCIDRFSLGGNQRFGVCQRN